MQIERDQKVPKNKNNSGRPSQFYSPQSLWHKLKQFPSPRLWSAASFSPDVIVSQVLCTRREKARYQFEEIFFLKMAFIPTVPCKLSQFPASNCQSFSSRHITLHSTPRRAYLCISNGSNNADEEISVPLSALNEQLAASRATASNQTDNSTIPDPVEEDNRTEKQKENDRLRAAEKFIAIDEGVFECTACSYMYEPKKGIKQSGIPPETRFQDVPDSFVCPICRSPKNRFISKKKIIAGFADNQRYGFGSNTLTAGQKSALIFGSLLFGFLLLLSGYALN